MFHTLEVAPGTRVHVLRDARFRRTSVSCFLTDVLQRDAAACVALLPAVLVRGTARHPKGHLLEQELARMYGARMSAGVSKSGDRQLVRIGLNLPNDHYARASTLGPGLDFLRDLLRAPWLPNGGFDPEYVSQEKRQLAGRIKALINNKLRYAMRRSVAQLFRGEPAAISEQGDLGDIDGITAERLAGVHRRVTNGFAVDVYIVGDVDAEMASELVEQKLGLAGRSAGTVPQSIVRVGQGPLRRVFEVEPMEQGWAVLGFRSGIAMGTAQRWPLEVMNGILGGYVHSKLFVNVRERANLAYQTGSFTDATKGAVIAYAGIDPANYDKACELILAQSAALGAGDFTMEDLEATRGAMATDLRLELDSPGSLISTHLVASGEGVYEDVPSSLEALHKVTKEHVVAAANALRPDTLFFLSGMTQEQLAPREGD